MPRSGDAEIYDAAGQFVSPVNNLGVSGQELRSLGGRKRDRKAIAQGDWICCPEGRDRAHGGHAGQMLGDLGAQLRKHLIGFLRNGYGFGRPGARHLLSMMDNIVSQLNMTLIAGPEFGSLDALAGQRMEDSLTSPIHEAVSSQQVGDDLQISSR